MATTKTTLKMVFKGTDATGDESLRTVSLENPRADLAEADVKAFMDMCVTKKALFLSGTDLPVTGIHEAYKEVTTKTPLIAAPEAPASPSTVSENTKTL